MTRRRASLGVRWAAILLRIERRRFLWRHRNDQAAAGLPFPEHAPSCPYNIYDVAPPDDDRRCCGVGAQQDREPPY